MEYNGLVLGAKCSPEAIQLEQYVKYEHIEFAISPSLLADWARRSDAISSAKKLKKEHNLRFTLHCPYDGVNGSNEYFPDSYNFGREVDAGLVIIHPSTRDGIYEPYNGIPIAVEVMKRMCDPQDVFDYMNQTKVRLVVFDGEHVKSAKLSVRGTFSALLPFIAHVHYSNTSERGYHDNLVGGKIPLSDFRFMFKKLKEKNSKANNICEVREEDWTVPKRTEENLQVMKALIDSLS